MARWTRGALERYTPRGRFQPPSDEIESDIEQWGLYPLSPMIAIWVGVYPPSPRRVIISIGRIWSRIYLELLKIDRNLETGCAVVPGGEKLLVK